MLEMLKEMYCIKILGRKIDLLIRFIIMSAIDMGLLYAVCFVQDVLYDMGIKCVYNDISAYMFIALWVFCTFLVLIITFNGYIDFTNLEKILFKK